MNDKVTVEEAAERLEGIARARLAQAAVVEIAGRVEIANRLQKAGGLEALQGTILPEVSEDSQGAMSGAAVLRALGKRCRDEEFPG